MKPIRARGWSAAKWAAAAAAAVLLIAPATGLGREGFGADLNNEVQPVGSGPQGRCCKYADPDLSSVACTRIAIGFGDVGALHGEASAPRDGRITNLRVISGGETGPFVPVVARVSKNGQKAKVTDKGPKHYSPGGSQEPPYVVDHLSTDLEVQKGEYLGIKSKRTPFLRCKSDGRRQLLFEPPLTVGAPFEHFDGTDGCVLLIQGFYKR
jgi:hypothetical protein